MQNVECEQEEERMPLQYLDFELLISERSKGKYPLTIINYQNASILLKVVFHDITLTCLNGNSNMNVEPFPMPSL